MRNIDTFNLITADLLRAGLEAFPSPAHITQDASFARLRPALERLYPEGLHHDGLTWTVLDPNDPEKHLLNLSVLWADTAWWLRSERYIAFEDADHWDTQVNGLVLTAKALEVLRAPVSALEARRSVRDVLTDAASWTGSAGAQAVITSGIETAFSLGVRLLAPVGDGA